MIGKALLSPSALRARQTPSFPSAHSSAFSESSTPQLARWISRDAGPPQSSMKSRAVRTGPETVDCFLMTHCPYGEFVVSS